MEPRNLFAALPADRSREHIEALLETPGLRLERIVTYGQPTPPGQWYDQPADEWVLLLRGRAVLRFEADAEQLSLGPGDWLVIPAHARHRVEWADPAEPAVWLALHGALQPA